MNLKSATGSQLRTNLSIIAVNSDVHITFLRFALFCGVCLRCVVFIFWKLPVFCLSRRLRFSFICRLPMHRAMHACVEQNLGREQVVCCHRCASLNQRPGPDIPGGAFVRLLD